MEFTEEIDNLKEKLEGKYFKIQGYTHTYLIKIKKVKYVYKAIHEYGREELFDAVLIATLLGNFQIKNLDGNKLNENNFYRYHFLGIDPERITEIDKSTFEKVLKVYKLFN